MNHKFLLLFLVCIISLFHCVSRVLGSPIVGGFEDDKHRIKFHVSIHKIYLETGKYVYICGGTIIHEKYVLTAAFCFMTVRGDRVVRYMDLKRDEPKIIAGTNKRQGPGIEKEVVAVFIPKSYETLPRQYADIAVMQLRDNLDVTGSTELKRMLPGALPDNEADEQATFCGFGHFKQVQQQRVSVLPILSMVNRFVTVKLLGASQCPDFRSKICSASYHVSDIRSGCDGDLGAGLIYEGKIVGVFSYGPADCNSNTAPNVFTRLSLFIGQVDRAMDERANHMDMHVLRKRSTTDEAGPSRLHI